MHFMLPFARRHITYMYLSNSDKIIWPKWCSYYGDTVHCIDLMIPWSLCCRQLSTEPTLSNMTNICSYYYQCIYFSLSPKVNSLVWPQFLGKIWWPYLRGTTVHVVLLELRPETCERSRYNLNFK